MTAETSHVRVRFAPSPTGYLHVGGARTALYNYLYAKKTGGDFILRVEDTDLERSTEESMRMQIQDLAWLDLKWDEGINPETLKDQGSYGPYRQSQRTAIYKEHAERLLENGRAYFDFRTDEELEKLKAESIKAGHSHPLEAPAELVPLSEARARIAAGEKAAVRFRIREKKDYVLSDLIRGDVTFPSEMVGDFVILRSNGMPVYNFCCAIDDALMKITHVFRAEEHLSNTLRQMMIYEAFGYALPKFGHLSIILGADRQKLSKRHGATSCHEYEERGYLAEALINFIALLGWSSPKGQEIMSVDEMIEQFSYDRFNPAAAVFDEAKLNWMNSTHLRALPHAELWARIQPFLQKAGVTGLPTDPKWQDQALSVFKTSMITLVDAVPLFEYLSDEKFHIKEEAKEILTWPESKKVWETWRELLLESKDERVSEADFARMQDQVKERCAVKGKHLFQPIRVAVIGKPHGPELNILLPLMLRSSLLKRVEICLKQI
jgi:nondiscriminating glutamyl-tRNA synthetase